MLKLYRTLGIALALAGAALLGLRWMVSAQEGLSPPYVIVLSPWSENATMAATDSRLGYAYVLANRGVAVFQALTRTGTIDLGSPNDIAVDATRGFAYVTNTSNYVSVFTATETTPPYRLGQVNVGDVSEAVAVLTTTGYAYVALPSGDRVAVLQGTTLIAPGIPVGDLPGSIAADPSTGYVYVANQGSHNVSVIQGATLQTTLAGGNFMTPTQVVVNPATGYVYVRNGDQTLTIYQGLEFKQRIAFTRGDPVGIAINAATGRVYVAINNRSITDPRGWIEVFEGETRLGIEIPLASDVRSLAINPLSGYIYVSHGSGTSAIVTIMSDTLTLESFPMGQTAPNIAVDPAQDLAYVPIYDGRVAIFGRTPVYASPLLDAAMTGPASFTCLNLHLGQYLPITITIQPEAVTASDMRVLCIPLREVESPGFASARQAFRLIVSYEPTGTVPSVYEFTPPLLVTTTYLSTLPDNIMEDELRLWRGEWIGAEDRWLWDATAAHFVRQSPAQNWLTSHLERTGYYALLWQTRSYLPLVMRH